jgi:hypothetical protein
VAWLETLACGCSKSKRTLWKLWKLQVLVLLPSPTS